jgi:predicted O-methyltransferase YrrM
MCHVTADTQCPYRRAARGALPARRGRCRVDRIACPAVTDTSSAAQQARWTAVDRYITERLLPADPVLDAALHDSMEAGLPRVGPALETLPQLAAEGAGPFELIFIDADKGNYPGYFDWSLKLSQPGTLIIGDNVVRDGAILNPDAEDPSGGNATIKGVRQLYELLGAEPRANATAIQTVGDKGHDGFALVLVE